jgi:hypothetical protein
MVHRLLTWALTQPDNPEGYPLKVCGDWHITDGDNCGRLVVAVVRAPSIAAALIFTCECSVSRATPHVVTFRPVLKGS